MACASVSAKITGSLSTIRCAARAAAAVSAVRLGCPLAITRARLQSITSIIAQNNLYNNGQAITLKHQYARLNEFRPPHRWNIAVAITAPMEHRCGYGPAADAGRRG